MYQLLPQQDNVVCRFHGVLPLPLFVERDLFIDLVADYRLVVSETGHITANMHRKRGYSGRKLRVNGLFDERNRDKDVVLLQGEVPGHAHSEHVAVLSIHSDDSVHELFRHPLAIPAVDMERGVAGPVLVVAVVKEAGELRGVPAHQ